MASNRKKQETLTLEPLRDKWESLGGKSLKLMGMNFVKLNAYEAKKFKIPTVIIATQSVPKRRFLYGR